MSGAADSYKNEDYQARSLPSVLCGRFIQGIRLPSRAVAVCPVQPIHTRMKTTKIGRFSLSFKPIHTRKKTTEQGCCLMSCEIDSNKKEDYQDRPLPNVMCG